MTSREPMQRLRRDLASPSVPSYGHGHPRPNHYCARPAHRRWLHRLVRQVRSPGVVPVHLPTEPQDVVSGASEVQLWGADVRSAETRAIFVWISTTALSLASCLFGLPAALPMTPLRDGGWVLASTWVDLHIVWITRIENSEVTGDLNNTTDSLSTHDNTIGACVEGEKVTSEVASRTADVGVRVRRSHYQLWFLMTLAQRVGATFWNGQH